MSNECIPVPDGEFDVWFNKFQSCFCANCTSWGFTQSDCNTVTTAYNNWHSAYTSFISSTNPSSTIETAKTTQRKTAQNIIQAFVTKCQANSSITQSDRISLGISTGSPGTITQVPVTPPGIGLDCGERGKVIIHVGETPGNEKTNSFGPCPSVLLQFRVENGDWQQITTTTKSPFVHIVGTSSPQPLQYRACYIGTNGQQGPWSKVDTAFVGAAA